MTSPAVDLEAHHDCAACSNPDADSNYVQCDACDRWWHFSCASVTESVSERAWICSKCTTETAAAPPTLVGNTSSSNIHRDLALLKQRQELERKRMEHELQMKFLDEQLKLMDNANHVNNCGGDKSVAEPVSENPELEDDAVGGQPDPPAAAQPTDVHHRDLLDMVHDLQKQLEICQLQSAPSSQRVDTTNWNISPTTNQHQYDFPKPADDTQGKGNQQARNLGAYKKTHVNEVGGVGKSNVDESGFSNKMCGGNVLHKSSMSPPDTVYISNRERQSDIREFSQNIFDSHQQQRIPFASEQQQVTFARSTSENVQSSMQPTTWNEWNGRQQQRQQPQYQRQQLNANQYGPSPQQLAARQSMARDLPQFSGDPADWPIFISNYDYTTSSCGYTDWENMLRLQRCLKGPALETVRSRLVLPAAVPQVIETLRRRYGRPELLINALLEKVRKIPAPKPDRLEGLIEYGLAVQALCDHIEAANEQAHLSNPTLLQELVGKLPADQKLMWAGYKRCLGVVNLKTFSSYMENLVNDASSVVLFAPETINKDKSKLRGYVNSHTGNNIEVQASKQIECIFCSRVGHRLRECSGFKDLNVDDRWRKVRALSLCQICLYRHGRRSCRSDKRCNIDGCQYRHHPLLHSTRRTVENSTQMQQANSLTHQYLGSSVLFRIVPVTLYGNGGAVNTYAFLDEGSSLTLVENEITEQLGVSGIVQPLCLRWTGNTTRLEENSKVVNIHVGGIGSQKRFKMSNVRTVANLNLPSQTFQLEEAAKQFEYLKQLPLQSYKNAVPKLLIGLDNLQLATPLKSREGDGNGPIAVKTRLGWCVYGKQQPGMKSEYSLHICECTTNKDLHDAVKQFYDIEEIGSGNVTLRSKEEQRALDLLEQTTVRVGEKFETGLLWAKDDVELPNSYTMALRRLECLEKKMQRDPVLKENVFRQIREFVSKGYIHKATMNELNEANPRRIWYLPLGVVVNPKKPEKIRIVCDAAAKVDGVSLNSMLLKGPDQLVSLLGVLFRFRQFKIAVCSDVREMFMQILIRASDKHSQRILWRVDPAQDPEVFLVDVATFGSTCSPASAQFVKNKNAREHSDRYPRAAEGILECTYVDDYLDSFGSVEEASCVSEEVRHIFRKGGFDLRNWISNSESVLRHLGETQAATSKSLITTDANTERVLGLLWNPLTDELSFSTRMSDVRSLLENRRIPTKRQVLRCVMTLFDPLGLLATFLIHGKILVQDLWRAGTGWDEEIDDKQFTDWGRWINMISHIANVQIPRCYFSNASAHTYEDTELHVFVDASSYAYSCVLYLRTFSDDGVPQCSLIAAKAKVAPLKPMTIPKLELQGCLLGARMTKFVQAHHSIPIKRRILWTDSSIALSWIRADPRNYRPFVANRVGEILEITVANEWRWVPSESNPADEATKWGSGPYFNAGSMWFHGPKFLCYPEREWPSSTDPVIDTYEEARSSVLYHVTWEPVVNYERFSKWENLQRSMAYVLRFINNARKKGERSPSTGLLTQSELKAAKTAILKQVQLEVFPEEVTTLKNNQVVTGNKPVPIEKSSTIYQLIPMLDEEGLMRQNSRISAAKHLHHSVRFPVILPRKHRCTELLVTRFHRLYRHANSETVVNEVRQLFAISKLRSVVKGIGRNCQFCKVRKVRPTVPPMAPLPAARLAVHVRPFSYVGVDYFGPLLVKQGRSKVKRWIALFTCLTVRAVHLEVAYSLSTASCISCIRRFVCRRGSPVEFFTDNATNFHGAERLLREQINEGVISTFTSAITKWTFIPPSAPHMGGAWERLVRSVKAAIGDAYTEGNLNDEELQTVIVEAEGIVNTRPLTYLPLDSAESESLTPNHFLLGSSNGVKQPCVDEECLKRTFPESWGDIQRQLNRFWQRWLKEYLPVIRKQSKWFDESRSVKDGDLVLIADEGKRNGWIRGIVIESIQAADGHVRQALVQTTGGSQWTAPGGGCCHSDIEQTGNSFI
ncbi:uncharacterized protein LOC129764157 [Toxorhynchites rutilus septentrionalis]|uniref:uncharacterized protein LOC129764157 n=1 Tax=Toxorhynchites rutilus septentrionalis TaxID=329112 RepID=UPI00247AF6F2|nr:uncharacterized protein LOC129764157 [Toxorhynchites rutilus septentrionalis]